MALVCGLASAAAGQNRLTVSSTGVLPGPGDRQVQVVIAADTATSLTGLNAELRFDRTLCDRIVAQHLDLGPQVHLSDASVPVDPEEMFGCPAAGRLSLIWVDLALRGEPDGAVVPAGHGELARWTVT